MFLTCSATDIIYHNDMKVSSCNAKNGYNLGLEQIQKGDIDVN